MENQKDLMVPIKLMTGKNGAIRKFWPRGYGKTSWYRLGWGKIGPDHYGYISIDPNPEEQLQINEEVVQREEAQVKQLGSGKKHLRVVA